MKTPGIFRLMKGIRVHSRLFVSAPLDADIRKLVTALRERGNSVVTWATVAPADDAQKSLKESIEEADVVVVVLTGGKNLGPAIEAGMAIALGKSLILLVDKGVAVPAALSAALLVRGKPGDVEAVQYALDQVGRRPTSGSPAIAPRAMKRETLGAESDALASQLKQLNIQEDEVLRILSVAIEASGALAVRSPKSDFGFDLGVWSDELNSISANPLLIEFTKSFTASKRKEVLTRLRANPLAQTALVIYMEEAITPGSTKLPYTRSYPPVLAISAQDLLGQLKSSTFPEAITRLRNRSVHGL